jgi:hypothetical protein
MFNNNLKLMPKDNVPQKSPITLNDRTHGLLVAILTTFPTYEGFYQASEATGISGEFASASGALGAAICAVNVYRLVARGAAALREEREVRHSRGHNLMPPPNSNEYP